MSSHYDHVLITSNGLRVMKAMSTYACYQWYNVDIYLMLHVASCFKDTALLFNVHLSFFMDFILCPTDK